MKDEYSTIRVYIKSFYHRSVLDCGGNTLLAVASRLRAFSTLLTLCKLSVLSVVKKLTTEDTKGILHKGHGGGFFYGKGMELKMWRRKIFRLYIKKQFNRIKRIRMGLNGKRIISFCYCSWQFMLFVTTNSLTPN